MAAQFFGSSRSDPELVIRNMRSAWERIAHERVQERLKAVFLHLPFLRVSRGISDDPYEKYSEQARRSRNSTSKVISRELENALRALENHVIQEALEIYEDEAPEKPIKTGDLLWAVYNFGLVPFIETEILRDVCSKLAKAQPSLGLDMWRPDAERFLSYKSAGLRKQFPVVIRIVDELKSQWRDNVHQRANQISALTGAVSSEPVANDQTAGKAPETQTQTIQPLPPDLQSSQQSEETSRESSAPIQSESELTEAEPKVRNVEPPAMAAGIEGNTIAKKGRSSTTRQRPKNPQMGRH